jgi:hypothetical protein
VENKIPDLTLYFVCGICNHNLSLLSLKKHGESLVIPKTVIEREFKDRMILVLHHIQGPLITLPTFSCSTAPPFVAKSLSSKLIPPALDIIPVRKYISGGPKTLNRPFFYIEASFNQRNGSLASAGVLTLCKQGHHHGKLNSWAPIVTSQLSLLD